MTKMIDAPRRHAVSNVLTIHGIFDPPQSWDELAPQNPLMAQRVRKRYLESGLSCVDLDGFTGWYLRALATREKGIDAFCHDGTALWCLGQCAIGKCIRNQAYLQDKVSLEREMTDDAEIISA